MDIQILKTKAIKLRKQFNIGQILWSGAHHGALFVSIICSLLAGALLKIDASKFGSMPAILTSVAAALTGIALSGGFERKWRSNRLGRSRIDILLLNIEVDPKNVANWATELKDIIAKHDMEIVNEAKDVTVKI